MSLPQFQAPGVSRRKVGDIIVTMLSEGYLDVSFDGLAGIGAADRNSARGSLDSIFAHRACARF